VEGRPGRAPADHAGGAGLRVRSRLDAEDAPRAPAPRHLCPEGVRALLHPHRAGQRVPGHGAHGRLPAHRADRPRPPATVAGQRTACGRG